MVVHWHDFFNLQPRAAEASQPICPSCPHGRNSIVSVRLAEDQAKAGLGDRHALLATLTAMAARVCARLDVERPCKMLTEEHNLGHAVSCAAKWSHYTDYTHIRTQVDQEPVWLEVARRNLSAPRGQRPVPLDSGRTSAEMNASFSRALAVLASDREFQWTVRFFYGWVRFATMQRIQRRHDRRWRRPHGPWAGDTCALLVLAVPRQKDALMPKFMQPFPHGCLEGLPQLPAYMAAIRDEMREALGCRDGSLLLAVHLRWRDTFQGARPPRP